MCFYNDGDSPEVWEQKIVKGRKEYRCTSCRKPIPIGQQHLSMFYVLYGDADRFRVCNLCAQDRVKIHRHEMSVGCRWDESWCAWEEIAMLIRRGDPDERGVPEFPGDDEYERDHVLFWPYSSPPAAVPVDLKQIPEYAA